MRKIKFRAWSPQHEKMFRIENICFDGAPTVILQYGPRIRTRLDNVFIMQFTGLHDKDGKEIFEGDIMDQVVYLEDDPCPFSVVFEDGSFRVKHPGWNETLMKPVFDSRYLSVMDHAVLGTIHENPELLVK